MINILHWLSFKLPVAVAMLARLIYDRMAGSGIWDKKFSHCKQEGNSARLRLALFHSFLFTMLVLFIPNTTGYHPVTYTNDNHVLVFPK